MYPILDYDPDPQAIVNPSDLQDPVDIAPAGVICFFLEVVYDPRPFLQETPSQE